MTFEVAGLKFRNPLLVASGPATKHVDQLIEAERHGWGGVSLKLAIDPPPYINLEPRYRWWDSEQYLAFSAEKRLTLDQALRLADEGRKRTRELIILANITYTGERGMDGWVEMASRFVAAGAHALELNMCCPNMSFNLKVSGERERTAQSGASLGQDPQVVGEATRIIVDAVDVPVFVKLTPEGGRIAEVAQACFDGGASVVGTTANRLAIPEFDIHEPRRGPFPLQDEPSVACFSGGWVKPLALRDVFEIRKKVGPAPCILGTGGVRNYVDAVQMMMCGADMVGICTEVMLRGFGFLPGLLKDIEKFMLRHGYRSYRDFRDLAAGAITPADRLTLKPAYARVDPQLCDGCGRCQRIGHCYAITIEEDKAVVAPRRCTGCSTCGDVCHAGAISLVEPADD
ncbi:MAG: dihydroorotate dehydrogenase [Planctomycetota bacterium]|jgi:dihydroorotate dehydrogenase/NAD-dependent dihydropyrimidine dehydrogenase PreA subunit